MKRNVIEFLAGLTLCFMEVALAISTSLFVFFGFSVITQGMKNISVAFQVFSWEKKTGSNDYLLNAGFFFTIASIFFVGLICVWALKKWVVKDLEG